MIAADPVEVRRALGLLVEPGAVVEIRALGHERLRGGRRGREVTWSGYYLDLDRATRHVVELDAEHAPTGIYCTLNPVAPDLRALRAERLDVAARGEAATDRDIVRRARLLIDFDAVRRAGISSSDAEHDAAITLAQEAEYDLSREGWPDALIADSGNGAHLIYAIDLPAADDGAVAALLAAAQQRWGCTIGDVTIKIDVTNANPARITKLYGTPARKGDSIEERPHRLSRILRAPERLIPVPREVLCHG